MPKLQQQIYDEQHQPIQNSVIELQRIGNISIQVLMPWHKQELLAMCIQEFGTRYPLTTAYCKFRPQESGIQIQSSFWNQYVSEMANNGLSVIACDLNNHNQIAAALLAVQYSEEQIPDRPDSHYNYYLHALRQRLLTKTKAQARHLLQHSGVVVELFGWVVASAYKSERLGQKLFSPAFQLAAMRGYDYAFGHPTNCISEHICRKLGFTLLAEQDSSTFECEGVRPFQQVEKIHRRATFYLKKLQKPGYL